MRGKEVMSSIYERLEDLRKKWLGTKDPTLRKVIERQAKLLKLGAQKAQEKGEDLFEKAKEIFG